MICLSRIKVFPAVCFVVASYFIWHGICGVHGYRRLRQVQAEIVLARQTADEIQARRAFLEAKVKSLSANALDMDQLEESALHFLSMGKPEDIILLSGH